MIAGIFAAAAFVVAILTTLGNHDYGNAMFLMLGAIYFQGVKL